MGDFFSSTRPQPDPKFPIALNINDCILNNVTECLFKEGTTRQASIVRQAKIYENISCHYFHFLKAYFCGYGHGCLTIGSRDALARAKANIEKHYPVVGVLERFRETLQLLEEKLPLFYKGAVLLYFEQMAGKRKDHTKYVG